MSEMLTTADVQKTEPLAEVEEAPAPIILSTEELLQRARARGDFADLEQAAAREKLDEIEAAEKAEAAGQKAATKELDAARKDFARLRDERHAHLLLYCDLNDSYHQARERYKAARRVAMSAGVPETTPEHDVVTASRPLSEIELRGQVDRITAAFKAGL